MNVSRTRPSFSSVRSLLVIGILGVVGALRAEERSEALPPHLVTARALLAAITPETNLYTASPSRIVWADQSGKGEPAVNHSVCSSFGALVLRKCYGIDKEGAIALFGEVAPEADDFFVAMRDSGRFELAPTVTDLRAGDFLTVDYLSKKAIPTGHVMLIDGPARRIAEHDAKHLPWPQGDDPSEWDSPTLIEWHVAVIDSSKSPHGEGDTRRRANPDGSDDNGLGRGDLRILTDPSGKIVGYTWSTSPNSRLRSVKERPMIAGRYLTS